MNNNFDAWPLSRTSLAGSQTTRSSSTSSQGQNGVRVNNPNHRSMPSSSNPTQNIFFGALVLGAPPQNISQQNPGLAPLIIPDDGVGATETRGILYNGRAAASPGGAPWPDKGSMPHRVGQMSNDN